jgi:hypothetical protein
MAVAAGPKTPFFALKDGTTGSFWSPRVLSSLWQDTAGTTPATVDSEVQRMDDLSGLGNHVVAPSGSRTIGDHTYTFSGPILRKEGHQYYLETDGDGAALQLLSAAGNWSNVTATNTFGITMSVAFYTDSNQGDFGSFGGTWLGTHSLGNFTSKWNFGLRLALENMFYSVKRNAENTAWITHFDEGNRYSTLNNSTYYDRPVIYTSIGTVDTATFGGKDFIDRAAGADFTNIAFTSTDELPVDFYNTFAIGARAPNNDNWIKGRFYGGAMIMKEISEEERKVIEDFLYVNCFL